MPLCIKKRTIVCSGILVAISVLLACVGIHVYKKNKENMEAMYMSEVSNMCGYLISTSLNITCKLNNKTVPCYDNVKKGTVASFKCRDEFELSKGNMIYNYTVCEDNTWNRELIEDCSLKKCPILDPISSTTLNITCIFNEKKRMCNEQLMHGTIVTFSCQKGFEDISLPYNTIKCEYGAWTAPLIKCNRKHELQQRLIIPDDKCSELSSTSVDITCVYKEKEISCTDPMPSGTTAKFKCKYGYELKPMPHENVECSEGHWNKPLINCIPICGITTKPVKPMMLNAISTDVSQFPWHVSLRIWDLTNWNYICGGSILSSKLVITAAHCVEKSDGYYQVIAGNLVSNSSEAEENTILVERIEVQDKYSGSKTSYTADLAILVLREEFIFSDIVKPICVDFKTRYRDENKYKKGKVPGWGIINDKDRKFSDKLQYATFPIMNSVECNKKYPKDYQIGTDKFCAGYKNRTSICQGDSGGGFVSGDGPDNDIEPYYLIGVVSTIVPPTTSSACGLNENAAYIDIATYNDWILKMKSIFEKWSPFDYGCKLPIQPTYGTYSISIDPRSSNTCTKNKWETGDLVPEFTKLEYKCNEGYEVHENKIVSCKQKVWDAIPLCFKKCPKLISSELEITYTYKNEEYDLPADGLLRYETRAKYRCIDSTHFELELSAYNENICRDDGWIHPVPRCTPICGYITHLRKEGSNLTIPTEYPWNVDIYENVSKNKQELVCSGSILSQFIILVEHTCVDKNKIERYTVRARRNAEGAEQQTTVFKVLEIPTSKMITLVVLKRSFKMTFFVHPVLINQDGIIRNSDVTISFPYRIEQDDDVKLYTAQKNIWYLMENFEVKMETGSNTAVIAVGGIVIPIESSKMEYTKQYRILGVAKILDPNTYTVEINILKADDVGFIQDILNIYNIQSEEMSECKIPEVRSVKLLNRYSNPLIDTVPTTTRMQYKCALSSYDTYDKEETVCNNQTWTKPPDCLKCGTSESINNEHRRNKRKFYTEAHDESYPWHVGIYDKGHEKPLMLCGGTILSANIVLTHSACFNYYRSNKITTILQTCRYVVGAGKLHNEFNTTLDKNAQYLCVSELVFKNEEHEDLVILILNGYFKINKFVLPACLDEENKLGLIHLRMPLWFDDPTYEQNSKIKFVYLHQSFTQTKFDIYEYRSSKHTSITCPLNWRRAKGSAIVGWDHRQYYVHYVLHDCKKNRLEFVTTHPYVKWLIYQIELNRRKN